MCKIINFNNNFRTNFFESINISGKLFAIKILSAYEFMLFLNEYNKLHNYFKNKKLITRSSQKAIEQACLAYFCLYDINNKNKRIFFSPITVLKNLTPYELKHIYKEYIKLQNKINFYDFKIKYILNKLKKLCVNNLCKKYKKIKNNFTRKKQI